MMGYDWGTSWGWMGFAGMLFMVLFWVVVAAGAVWAVNALSRPRDVAAGPRPEDGGGAVRILEERLAKGEIDVEEFRSRRAAMQEHAR
jgi:putative membrane protein